VINMIENTETKGQPSGTTLQSRRTLLRSALGLAAVLAGGTTAACGSGGSADGDREVTVKMTDEMTFESQRITVPPGTVVVFKNTGDRMVHTATGDPRLANDHRLVSLPDGVDPWNSGNVQPGASWSMRFETPGTYRYVCLPHELADMTGEIIVEAE
jgi:plastocyanin